MARRPRDPFEIAMAALARREFSVQELTARLARAGVGEDEAAATVDRLRRAGHQSDDRTAAERARVLAARQIGDAAIAADLGARGLSEETVQRALADLPDEIERAAVVARLGEPRPALAATLRRRGFSADTIETVLVAVVANES